MENSATPLEAAHAIIGGVPRLARLMRQDLRKHSAGLFTEPQFRVMAYLFREGKTCLSGLAEYQGVSLPTMSKLIQGLEARDLVTRERDSEDRRRVLLRLTPAGCTAYEQLLRRTENHIVEWIEALNGEERADVIRIFERLVALFAGVNLDDYYGE